MLGFASQLLLAADVNCRVQILLMIAIHSIQGPSKEQKVRGVQSSPSTSSLYHWQTDSTIDSGFDLPKVYSQARTFRNAMRKCERGGVTKQDLEVEIVVTLNTPELILLLQHAVPSTRQLAVGFSHGILPGAACCASGAALQTSSCYATHGAG